MKNKFIFLVSLLMTNIGVYAQEGGKQSDSLNVGQFYFNTGGGINFDQSGILSIGINVIGKSHWGFSMGYLGNYYEPVNLPDDYVDETCLGEDCGDPRDAIHTFTAGAAWDFKSRDQNVMFGIESGLTYNIRTESQFKEEIINYWIFGYSNYTVEKETSGFPGYYIKAKAGIKFSRMIGLNLSLIGNVNPGRPYAGFEMCLLFGKLK